MLEKICEELALLNKEAMKSQDFKKARDIRKALDLLKTYLKEHEDES